MAMPNLDLTAQSQIFELDAMFEMRIEIKEGEWLTVTLVDGFAEIFGREMILGAPMLFHGLKFAIFTWERAVIQLDAPPKNDIPMTLGSLTDAIYMTADTPVNEYFNIHNELELERIEAAQQPETKDGPRTIIVGPTDAGKSSLAKTLLAYALRMQHSPMAVDLDIGQGEVAIPGCIGAARLEPVEMNPLEAILEVPNPLAYFFGHVSVAENPVYYKHLVERLALALDEIRETTPGATSGGMVINTMGFVEGLGYELLLHSIKTLRVDRVLVMQQDRLQAQLTKDLSGQAVKIQKVTRSGGLVQRSTEVRKATRDRRVTSYFWGPTLNLLPTAVSVPLEKLQIYRVGSTSRAPSSALPLGHVPNNDPLRVMPVRPGLDLMHQVLAVSYATKPDEIPSASVAGFIHVVEIDMNEQTMTYTAPNGMSLPGRYLIAGSLMSRPES